MLNVGLGAVQTFAIIVHLKNQCRNGTIISKDRLRYRRESTVQSLRYGGCGYPFSPLRSRPDQRVSIRYLTFVWDCTDTTGDMEEQVMGKLSPTLRSKLCVYLSLGYTGTGGAYVGVPVHLHRYTATNFIPVSLRYA